MATMKGRCGCWLVLPEEALQSERAFAAWFKEFHWPVCRDNPRSKERHQVFDARHRSVPTLRMIEFNPTIGYEFLEVIPERPEDGLWRVLNRRTKTWPQIAAGDYLDVTDVENVIVISKLEFTQKYERAEKASDRST